MTGSIRIPREAIRYPVWITATCRTSLGRVADVILSNLSTDGCGMTIGEGVIRPGQTVVVRMPSIEALNGQVCWVKGSQAGVKFERRLYGPVLEHLVRVQLGSQPPPPPAATRSVRARRV
jgi:hypothetical protein